MITIEKISDQLTSGQLNRKIGYTVAELSASVGVSRTKLFMEIREKRLRSALVCGRRIIRAEDVDDWLNRHFADESPPQSRESGAAQ